MAKLRASCPDHVRGDCGGEAVKAALHYAAAHGLHHEIPPLTARSPGDSLRSDGTYLRPSETSMPEGRIPRRSCANG